MYPADDLSGRVMFLGHWKSGEKDGHGQTLWKDGLKYIGDFKDGTPHGQGKWTQLIELLQNHWTN